MLAYADNKSSNFGLNSGIRRYICVYDFYKPPVFFLDFVRRPRFAWLSFLSDVEALSC